MNLYNLRTAEPAFTITKFDSDLNPESTYTVDAASCTCPQGHRPTCRHRRMLPLLLPRVDTAWFLRFEDSTWHDPTGEAAPIEEAQLELPIAATAGPSFQQPAPAAGPSVSVPAPTPTPAIRRRV